MGGIGGDMEDGSINIETVALYLEWLATELDCNVAEITDEISGVLLSHEEVGKILELTNPDE